MNRSGQQGFSLMELMIAVAIVAIIATIAIPSYQQYVIRTNRSAAQQFMLDIANRQEQFMLDARSYTATLGAGGLNLPVPPEVDPLYTITLAAPVATPPTYTITATPKAGSRQAGDVVLGLTSTGVKTPAGKW